MTRIHEAGPSNISNETVDVMRFRMPDGSFAEFTKWEVDNIGIHKLLTDYVANLPRVPIMQNGRKVGSFPATFDPLLIKSRSPIMYQPRPGDFIKRADHWEACRTLGPGDFEAIPGYNSR